MTFQMHNMRTGEDLRCRRFSTILAASTLRAAGRGTLHGMTPGGEELFRFQEIASTEVYRLAAGVLF